MTMTNLKVGQLRQDCKGMYVITKIDNCAYGDYCCRLYSDGVTESCYNEELQSLERDELITEYKGWLNALNSDEFKNNECNF